MKAIRQRVRVREDGRLEITDPALRAGADAEIVVLLPEPAGDGAPADAPSPPTALPGHSLDEMTARPPRSIDQILGSAPSGRTASEIDRDLRALRDEWEAQP